MTDLTVTIKQTYGASITNGNNGTVDNRPQAYAWLRDNGYDDIIKNTIPVNSAWERTKKRAVQSIAEQKGYLAEQKTDIHSQTLRAFVKERVKNGDDFPMELFGAYVGQRALIKRGK